MGYARELKYVEIEWIPLKIGDFVIQLAADRSSNLSDLERMSESIAKEVGLVAGEELGLPLESSKR